MKDAACLGQHHSADTPRSAHGFRGSPDPPNRGGWGGTSKVWPRAHCAPSAEDLGSSLQTRWHTSELTTERLADYWRTRVSRISSHATCWSPSQVTPPSDWPTTEEPACPESLRMQPVDHLPRWLVDRSHGHGDTTPAADWMIQFGSSCRGGAPKPAESRLRTPVDSSAAPASRPTPMPGRTVWGSLGVCTALF